MKSWISRSTYAFDDLNALATFIQRDSPEAAIRFLAAAETSFELLASMPELGQRQDFGRAELADLRAWQVRGFENYLIFYKPLEQGIEIIRVLHASRDLEAVFEDSASY